MSLPCKAREAVMKKALHACHIQKHEKPTLAVKNLSLEHSLSYSTPHHRIHGRGSKSERKRVNRQLDPAQYEVLFQSLDRYMLDKAAGGGGATPSAKMIKEMGEGILREGVHRDSHEEPRLSWEWPYRFLKQYPKYSRAITTANRTEEPGLKTGVDPSYHTLFQTLESRFQSTTTIPSEKWPILAIATLAASPDPDHAHNLYLYLTNQPSHRTPDARKALVRRLREALVKTIPLVGVCKPIEAVLSISNVEQEADKDYETFTREDWRCDERNHERGTEWFQKLYKGNASATLDLFAAHKDFAWLSMEITYGLFLSDRQVLDDLDTQLVVLPAIMSQNLKTETHWHIRGTRRLGVSMEDVKVIWDCVQLVASFFDVKLNRVPTVEDAEPDV